MFIQISIFYIYILRMVNVYNLQGERVDPNVKDHQNISVIFDVVTPPEPPEP